jgi:hypothetical protein
VRLNAVLQFGQVNDIVEVSTVGVQVQTDDTKVSASVQNKPVDELPLVVTEPPGVLLDLVTIAPEGRPEPSAIRWTRASGGLERHARRSVRHHEGDRLE